jgi:hypothetical protein
MCSFSDRDITCLPQQASIRTKIIRSEMKIRLTDAEPSEPFGQAGGWAQGMILRDLKSVSSEKVITRGRPNAAESQAEKSWCSIAHPDNPKTIRLLVKLRSI